MPTEASTLGAVTDVELRRLQWHCRRGLLELDLALTKFLGRHAARLQRAELIVLNELLELNDNELWDLVSGQRACNTARYTSVLQKLQEN